ncbi:hypothetical protein WICMUC_004537 [Wickerhamomyces mucosus]|uniref:Uncharacterized protein n=1 Tax=Wickerhamomyces mucosus TaxID=1378264 RepID=A0A9P8PIE9_9ASCO|nr:hypothetical protein WICMUC_004537 [Wickerhamomyces mucosus]
MKTNIRPEVLYSSNGDVLNVASTNCNNDFNLLADDFHLGYTYINYRDDSNEPLSTLEIYTLSGSYIREYDSILKTLSSKLDLNNLLVVHLLDYNENPTNWLFDLQIWTNALKDVLKRDFELLNVVLNKRLYIDIEQEIHEFIQLNLRIVSLKYNSSLIYDSLSSEYSNTIALISYLLKIPVKELKPTDVKPNFTDYSSLLIPKGADDISKISTLNSEAGDLADKWDSSDSNNTLIKLYNAKLSGSFQEQGHKVSIEESITKPKDLKYPDFLSSLYEHHSKPTDQILNEVLGEL